MGQRVNWSSALKPLGGGIVKANLKNGIGIYIPLYGIRQFNSVEIQRQ